MEEGLALSWKIANGDTHGLAERTFNKEALTGIPGSIGGAVKMNAGGNFGDFGAVIGTQFLAPGSRPLAAEIIYPATPAQFVCPGCQVP